MNDLAKAREKVEALTGYSSHAVADMMNDETWIRKADVLSMLGEEMFTRDDTWPELPLTGGGSYESPNTRKGQRRVKIQRYYDDILQGHGLEAPTYGRRIGKERRYE